MSRETEIVVIDVQSGERIGAEIDGAPPRKPLPGWLAGLGAVGAFIVIGALALTFFTVALVIMVPVAGWFGWKLHRAGFFRQMKAMRERTHR